MPNHYTTGLSFINSWQCCVVGNNIDNAVGAQNLLWSYVVVFCRLSPPLLLSYKNASNMLQIL